MDLKPAYSSLKSTKCCNCDCACNLGPPAAAAATPWPRCVKRKVEQIMLDTQTFLIENECSALREELAGHQQTIQELCTELDEERNAAASAADEAMSMILRLQREKAEVQMESRQYQRFAEEKMAHDQQELQQLEEALYKREQLIQALNFQIQAYKHRLMSFGCYEEEGRTTSNNINVFDNIECESEYEFCKFYDDYPPPPPPPLKCGENAASGFSDATENQQVHLEKYALVDTPLAGENLQNLEFRIGQLEKNPESTRCVDAEFASIRTFLEKATTCQPPSGHGHHHRKLSQDSTGSSSVGVVKEVNVGNEFVAEARVFGGFKEEDATLRCGENSIARKVDSEFGDDENDRVYTIDSVHRAPCNGDGQHNQYKSSVNNECAENCRTSSNEPSSMSVDLEELDMKKLHMRLEALEADRESMRQAIVSMSTDKAQLVLLKEIAQKLCRDMSTKKTLAVRKPSIMSSFSLVSIIKWLFSFFWRKKAHRSKCTYELSNSNLGMLLLLERSPQMKQWRCLSRLGRV